MVSIFLKTKNLFEVSFYRQTIPVAQSLTHPLYLSLSPPPSPTSLTPPSLFLQISLRLHWTVHQRILIIWLLWNNDDASPLLFFQLLIQSLSKTASSKTDQDDALVIDNI